MGGRGRERGKIRGGEGESTCEGRGGGKRFVRGGWGWGGIPKEEVRKVFFEGVGGKEGV